MPKYLYVAKTKKGQTIKGDETAVSQEELVARLRGRGLFLMSITEASKASQPPLLSIFTKNAGSRRGSIKLYDLTMFSRNLATTLSSGVTLLRSLEILASQSESLGMEKVLKKCSDDIRSGLSLSEAIAKHPRVFGNLWRGIVEVGEASGNLPFVLDKLADYLEARMEFQARITGAMIYPAILMIVATMVLFAFFKFILPKFAEIFTQFNVKLPLATQIMFNIGNFFDKSFGVLLVGIVGLVAGTIYGFKQPDTRKWWDEFSLRMPIVGSTFLLASVERFTSTMHILLESGLPLVYTLETSAKSVGNTHMEKIILQVKEKVREGNSLSEEISRTQLFPLMISEMAKIGEETGTLPDVFKKVAVHYQKELSQRMSRFLSMFEPLMIVFMGLIIGTMVISLFLPIFKLSSGGGGG